MEKNAFLVECMRRSVLKLWDGIKTFKTFVEERRYKGKKISHQLTVHHLKHISEGGKTNLENCANIAEVAHQYMHSLKREDEEIINNWIRDFKINFVEMKGDGTILGTGSYEPAAADYMTIPAYPTERRKKEEKRRRLKNPNRAARKREFRKIVEEELDR